MSRNPALILTIVVGSALLSGCARLPRDAGFPEVQELVQQRSGLAARWNRQAVQDDAVADRVQELLSAELTAESAAEVALLNNRRLQAAFEDLGIARAELLLAGRPSNPMLGGELRYPATPYKAFEVLLTQSLLDLFQLPARKRTAAAVFEQAKLRVADEVLALVAEARSVSYALQCAEQVTGMRRTIVESEGASAELAIRQHAAGNITDLELETVQGAYEQAKLELARGESEVLAERERLNVLMGVWGPATAWTIETKLPDVPGDEPSLDDVESIAMARRLDLAAARQEMEAAAQAIRTARGEANGDVTLGVHRERDAEGGETTGPSLEFPLPIFGRGGPAKSRAEARLAQQQERYTALAVEIRSNVRAARNRLVAARARVEYYRDVILPRRRRIVEQSLLEYNAMLRGIFQVLEAKHGEIEAQRESIEAGRDYWVARVELEHSMGWVLSSGGVRP